MATVTVERESQEMVEATVVTDANPTSNPVEWAFPAVGGRPDVWHAGVWKSGSASQVGDEWTAVARTPVIGAGSVDLEPERYDVYLKITSGTEVPVLRVGRLKVR